MLRWRWQGLLNILRKRVLLALIIKLFQEIELTNLYIYGEIFVVFL